MNKREIIELKVEARDWKTRGGISMPAGQSQAFVASVLKLITYVEQLEAIIDDADLRPDQ